MDKSPTIGNLAKALALAQSQIKGAVSDSKNPFFKSSYADLESVWDAIRVPLSSNSLSVSQIVDGMDLHTILMHESGEYLSSKYPLTPKDSTPQGIGSAITYARRYSLAAIAGVYQVDDDGEADHGRAQPQAQVKPQVAPKEASPKPIENHAAKVIVSKEQAESLRQLGFKNGWSIEEMCKIIYDKHKVRLWTDMTQPQFSEIWAIIAETKKSKI